MCGREAIPDHNIRHGFRGKKQDTNDTSAWYSMVFLDVLFGDVMVFDGLLTFSPFLLVDLMSVGRWVGRDESMW